jgi:hypothetical protein
MKRKRRKLLDQVVNRDIFGNRDYEGSGSALWNKGFSVEDDCTDSIAHIAKSVICELEMLALIGHDKTDNILGNENWRPLPVIFQLF